MASKSQSGEDIEMRDDSNFDKNIDPVGDLFGIEFESTFKNIESEQEPEKVVKE